MEPNYIGIRLEDFILPVDNVASLSWEKDVAEDRPSDFFLHLKFKFPVDTSEVSIPGSYMTSFLKSEGTSETTDVYFEGNIARQIWDFWRDRSLNIKEGRNSPLGVSALSVLI